MNPKIVSLSKLSKLRKEHLSQKICLVSGCFDLLHFGHVRFLEAVKKTTDILIVMILTDTFVKKRKTTARPIYNEKDRAGMIAALSVVDYACLCSYEKVENLIKNLQPDTYGVGGDRKNMVLPEKKILDKYQVKIRYYNRFGSISSTSIIQKLKKLV